MWSWPGRSEISQRPGRVFARRDEVLCRLARRRVLWETWPVAARVRWLSPVERAEFGRWRDITRGQAWLWGRFLAKDLILGATAGSASTGEPLHPAMIEICSRDGFGRGIRPQVLVNGRLMPWSVSIAHSDDTVLAALSLTPGLSVGVDLVGRRPLLGSFARMWLTAAEQMWCWSEALAEPDLPAKLWAVKEAFYKASNAGEPFRPEGTEVRRDAWGAWTVDVGGREANPTCRVHVREGAGEVAVVVTVMETWRLPPST